LPLSAPSLRRRLIAGFRNDTPGFPHGSVTIPPVSRRGLQRITENPHFNQYLKTGAVPTLFQPDTRPGEPQISTPAQKAQPCPRDQSRKRPDRVNQCPIFNQTKIDQGLTARPSRQAARNTACRAPHRHPRTDQDPTHRTAPPPTPGNPENTLFINAPETRRRSETPHPTGPSGPDSPGTPKFETPVSHAQCRKHPVFQPPDATDAAPAGSPDPAGAASHPLGSTDRYQIREPLPPPRAWHPRSPLSGPGYRHGPPWRSPSMPPTGP